MDDILTQLIDMTRRIADPTKDLAILGEGNTSARADEDSFYVKASGTSMTGITEDGFVRVSISRVLALLDDPSADDAAVTRVFQDALVVPGEKRRPSVEAILHAILLQIPEYRFVGHAHPVYTNTLMCSVHAEEAATRRLFPDQIVSMGPASVFVPYVDPGLPLAREVKRRLEQFVDKEGMLPTAILMQNHGLITMGASVKAVLSCMDMTEKSMRILYGTYAIGGPHFLEPGHVERIATRPDEIYRLQHIAGNQ